jgi:hypothetical protein
MSVAIGRFESPFVDVGSFELAGESVFSPRRLSSPFVEGFIAEHAGGASDGGLRRVLLAEMYDEEFDDAVYELVGEAAAGSLGSTAGAAALRVQFAPLAEELESFIERSADALGTRDAASFTELEIEEVLSRTAAAHRPSPEFENFFGAIKKAVSRVAKGAVKLAKKGVEAAARLGLGPILAKLKALVRPLLERVLKAAISRLPAAVQPAARKLAEKLPALFREIDTESEDPAMDIAGIQGEFNERAADVLLGASESAFEAEGAGWPAAGGAGHADIGELDEARERFVSELEQLEDGEDPGPAVERFVPALLPVLKLGLRLAGRKRVVGLLAGVVSKLIVRFVGPASSGALSTALVDAGLKLLGLEITDNDQRRAATSAVAATVEDTVRRVSAFPDAVLDNETLLEASVIRAFEDAAAANLPPVLSAAVYRRRPELAETDDRRGSWVAMPIRGPKRYKKFSRVIRTRITPRTAMSIGTFGAAPLAQYLQEQLGLEPGEDLEADVHLYEALPGTVLSEVAQLEANGHGAASTAEFHPLTPEAAALLVRAPGLGRASSAPSPSALNVGARFFRAAVPGRRVAVAGGARGAMRRRSSVFTTFDFPGDRISVYLFLSERRAQEIAATLRKQGHAGAVATRLKTFIDRSLETTLRGRFAGRVRLVHEALTLDEARGAALGRVPRAAVQALAGRVGQWTLSALTDYLSAQSATFVAATEHAQDGVTVVVTLSNPPGMGALRSAVAATPPAGGDPAATGAPGAVHVDVVPGFTNG